MRAQTLHKWAFIVVIAAGFALILPALGLISFGAIALFDTITPSLPRKKAK